MKRNYYFPFIATALLFALAACSSNEGEEEPDVPQQENTVCFEAGIEPLARATDTHFDTNDAIGVFGVLADGNGSQGIVSPSGNYADNVRYIYNGSQFTSANGIEQPQNGDKVYYHAVYPYVANASNQFTFTVQADQTGDGYTNSDLLTASTEATDAALVSLKFSHRLSKLIINLQGDNWPSGTPAFEVRNAQTSVNVDLNALTFTGNGNYQNVRGSDDGTKAFKAILPPQTFAKGSDIGVLYFGDTGYSVNLAQELTLKSGKQIELTLSMNDNQEIVVFTGDINPWEDDDEGGTPDNPDDNPGTGSDSNVKSCSLIYGNNRVEYTHAYLCDLGDGNYTIKFCDYDLYADILNPVAPDKYINWLVIGFNLPNGQKITALPEGDFEYGTLPGWDIMEGYYVNLSIEDWEDTPEYRNFNTTDYSNSQYKPANMAIRKSGDGYTITIPQLSVFDTDDYNETTPMYGEFHFEGTLRYISFDALSRSFFNRNTRP